MFYMNFVARSARHVPEPPAGIFRGQKKRGTKS